MASFRVPDWLRTRPSPRVSWIIAGLIVFLLVDAGLVVWAIANNSGTSASSHPELPAPVEAAPSSSSTATPPATPKSTPSPTQANAPDAVAASRVLAALDGSTAWRAATGTCPTSKAAAQLTRDGGKTWKGADVAGPTGASAIVRILPINATNASMVTLSSQGCAVQFVRTYVSGDNWETGNSALADTWYLSPAARTKVHSPKGDMTAPCASAIALAPRDATRAAVLCADHSVYRTTDAGATWSKPVTVPGAVALTDGGSTYVIAVTDQARCAGVGIVSLADTATTLPKSVGSALDKTCYRTAAVAPGEIAVAQAANTIWLWAGAHFARSTNGGGTWQ